MGKPRKKPNQQSQQNRKSKVVQSVREELWEKLEKTEIQSDSGQEDSDEEESLTDEDGSEVSKEESEDERDFVSFPVAMWDLLQCDPKRCSGRKLSRLGMIKELKLGQKWSGICLSPKGNPHYAACLLSDHFISLLQEKLLSPPLTGTSSSRAGSP